MLDLLKQSWTVVQDALRREAGAAVYDSWLAELRPLLMERSVVYIEAKSKMVRDRVQRLFKPLLQQVLSHEIGVPVQVIVQDAPGHTSNGLERLEVSPQQPVVDDANRTAWLVLKSLLSGSELPGVLFCFHGPAGVGKSFLLRHYLENAKRSVVLFLLPDLLKVFQVVHYEQRVEELRLELLTDRPLVLDEIHRISGKPKLQAFVHALIQQRQQFGRLTLIASRWHPKDIRDLDDGLCSTMLSGFVAKIDLPSPLGRLRYLRALDGAPSRNGRAHAIEAMAQQVPGSYPELRHAWTLSRSGGLPIKYLELIDPGRVFARVRDRVCDRIGVSEQEILGKGQSRRVSQARKLLAFLCVQEGLSRAEVGRFLTGRTRAAVSYMTKSVAEQMSKSPEIRALVEGLL
ncbi:MAG: DnaA N-terminal domain-containing protein [Planctomycetota bacterium]